MIISKKKFIYLISPNKIKKTFFEDLSEVLKTKKVCFFQLRLKKTPFKKKLIIGKKVKKICRKYGTKFLINDDVLLTQKLNADGCHLGQNDMQLSLARKILKKKIIGITCHNSINLAKVAIKNKFHSETSKNFTDALNKISSKKKKLIVCFGSLYNCGNILNIN